MKACQLLSDPFHTEHDPPDVIGLDNNTTILLADSKTTRRRLKAFTRDELVEVRIMLNGGRV